MLASVAAADRICSESIVQWDMAETASGGPLQEVVQADIFINCIYLVNKIPPFITQSEVDQADRKLSVIVDVSCDITNPFNPIPIYHSATTFVHPTLAVASRYLQRQSHTCDALSPCVLCWQQPEALGGCCH